MSAPPEDHLLIIVINKLFGGVELTEEERSFTANFLMQVLRDRRPKAPHRQSDPQRQVLIAMEYELRNDGQQKTDAIALTVAKSWGLSDGNSVKKLARKWRGRYKIEPGQSPAMLEWIEKNRY